MKSHERNSDILTPSFTIIRTDAQPGSSSYRSGEIVVSNESPEPLFSACDDGINGDDRHGDTGDGISFNISEIELESSTIEYIKLSANESLDITPPPPPASTPPPTAVNLSITKSKKWQDILAHTDAVGIKEADVYHSLMKHLKLIKNKRQQFLSLLFKLFGIERLADTAFIYLLATKLSMDRRNLKRSIECWFSSGMEESRGKWALSNEIRQDIYDTWVENITPSTDDRNDRVSVKIAKLAYLKKYKEIENKTVQLKEEKNKRLYQHHC